MPRDLNTAIRELCLGLPETTEVLSHGTPDFRVAGKTFATLSINHHGDGRVALWLQAEAGAQQLYTEMEPDHYFVPPYVGPKGWLGVLLNSGLPWSTIALRVREAYLKMAPVTLAVNIPELLETKPPDVEMRPEDIDPYLRPRAQEVLAALKDRCTQLPESSPGDQFGAPVWKAGKKTYVTAHYDSNHRLCLQFRVGAEQQSMLCMDERYKVPAYTGHNGWISLDVEDYADWAEIEHLLLTSYRHFALKRMLKALEENPALGG